MVPSCVVARDPLVLLGSGLTKPGFGQRHREVLGSQEHRKRFTGTNVPISDSFRCCYTYGCLLIRVNAEVNGGPEISSRLPDHRYGCFLT